MTELPYVYDAGALIALERDDRRMWAKHRLALDEGRVLMVPAVVLTQVWRGSARQHSLHRALDACQVVIVDEDTAKA